MSQAEQYLGFAEKELIEVWVIEELRPTGGNGVES